MIGNIADIMIRTEPEIYRKDITVKKKGGAEYLIRLICAELLVVKNASNNILNEIYNFGLLLVLDWMDIIQGSCTC